MSMAQTPDLDATWGSSFLPLHQPLLQMPFARQRAMRLGSPGLNNNIPPHLEHRFTSEQLQSLFQQFPASYAALTSNQKQQRSKTTTSTTTTVPTTTTTPSPTPTPTTTTPGQSMQHRRRRPPHSNEVPIFHYGGIEGREDYAVGPAEDDAVVLLVGLFNLLAIVVYAASKFVMGAQGSLSDRVIQWQVQKVLDELVIKVHSSQYMANLLSRAMPNDAVSLQQGRRVGGQAMASWKDLLQQKLRMLLLQNTSTETTEWFSAVKEQLMWEIGSSPAAMSTVRLHPYIYKPLKQIYKALTSEDGQKQFLEFISRGTESGRSLPAMKNNISWLLDTLTDLKFNPIRSIMAQEPSQQRINITAMPTAAMRSQSWLDENQDTEPSSDMDTAKVMSHVDSFVQILANYVAESFNQPKQRLNDEVTEKEHLTPFSRNFENESWDTANKRDYDSEKNIKETHNRTVEPSSSTLLPLRRSSSSSSSLSQLAKRQVAVDNSPWAERNNGHWTDRWFSLVTQLSPVGLDITTLYARARARPKCFRALLCRANNAWRQVGPVQAALTPFTSVLVSWLLEDTMPHSLGDSLIAVRAGWMGKDCSLLFPECPLQPDPHPAAKEAITFFSRLQFAATATPEITEGPLGAQSGNLNDFPPQSRNKPITNDTQTTDNVTERVDSHQPHEDTGVQQPYTAFGSNPHYNLPSPQLQNPEDNQRVSHSHNYPEGAESEQSTHPNRQLTSGNAAALQAYYTRYKGQGPMVVPGSQYSSKYGHFDDDRQKDEKLYFKYDSPSTTSAEGEISGSNSVSGMALQDHTTGNDNRVWEEFFKAGLYGGIVPQSPLNIKELPSSSTPEKSTQISRPMKKQISSLNKIGALHPDQPGIFSNPEYGPYRNINKGLLKPSRPHKRPYFTLRPKRPHTTGSPSTGSSVSSTKPFIMKYKYGLRRGLPATNVNGYNAYVSNSGDIYQKQKPWYSYLDKKSRPIPHIPSTSPKPTTPLTTTVRTTGHSLTSKDTDRFGPEDAVTDVLRNELLYEYIRDRQGSILLEDQRSLM